MNSPDTNPAHYPGGPLISPENLTENERRWKDSPTSAHPLPTAERLAEIRALLVTLAKWHERDAYYRPRPSEQAARDLLAALDATTAQLQAARQELNEQEVQKLRLIREMASYTK